MQKDYSVKAIRESFKEKGIFYTPPELALYLKSLVDITGYKEVYDPTCGRGNLLSVFEDDIDKYGQDINEEELEVAKKRLKNFVGAAGDTLKEPAFMDKKFEVIVANPPFSVSWEEKTDVRFEKIPCLPPKSKADYAFLLHILHMLSDDGVAVVMNFPGILYRGNREGKIRKWLIEKNYIDKVIHIAGNRFTDTAISTCVLVLKKNRKQTSVLFVDTELEVSRSVSFEEIKENDYKLSVSSFIQVEEEKEEIDLVALEQEIRTHFLNGLEKEIERVKFIHLLSDMEYKSYILEMYEILKKEVET